MRSNWILGLVFVGVALVVYVGCLNGPFVSDDFVAVAENDHVKDFDVVEILKPYGGAVILTSNYGPVYVLAHAIQWHFFQDWVLPYHVTNIVLHALASLLLVLWFQRVGLSRRLAVVAGALFLLHPANVEAVAWISQLKTSAALALALGALLLEGRRGVWAVLLFGLSLLAKPTAAVALAAAVLFVAFDDDNESARSSRWLWLGAWLLVLAVFAVVEFAAFSRGNPDVAPLHEDPIVNARTIVANAMRYLVMAVSSYGLSTFHEARPAHTWFDPWWLSGVVALALLAWRSLKVLFARQREAIFWAWAVISYAPISQIFPFLYPVADRYLYFILPGLLGGAFWLGRECFERWLPEPRRLVAARALMALGVVTLIFFGIHSATRAAIWRSSNTIALDSARHYPNGIQANLLRAVTASQRGDPTAAAAALRAAFEGGWRHLELVLDSEVFAPLHSHPELQPVLRDMASYWIGRIRELPDPSQNELHLLARAYTVRGEFQAAADAYQQALVGGGPRNSMIQAELEELERLRQRPETR